MAACGAARVYTRGRPCYKVYVRCGDWPTHRGSIAIRGTGTVGPQEADPSTVAQPLRLLEKTMVQVTGYLTPRGVILGVAASIVLVGAAHARPPRPKPGFFNWPPVCEIHSRSLLESSGIVKSARLDGIYWTHNDSGNPPSLFAVNLRGDVVAEILLRGAKNVDFEDIGLADGLIYIGDVGDNLAIRKQLDIYVVQEPDLAARPPKSIEIKQTLHFTFPEGPVDCEALFLYQGHIHVITKETRKRPTLYRLDPGPGGQLTPVALCTVPIAPITAADVSRDGTMLAVISYGQLAVFDLSQGIGSIETQQPKRVSYPIAIQTEGCTFDGGDVIICSESGYVWRITAAEIRRQLRILP